MGAVLRPVTLLPSEPQRDNLTPKTSSHGSNQEPGFLRSEASKIGYPVLIKAVKGGGGKGMRIATRADEFEDQLKSAKSEALNSFADDIMLVEKYIMIPRHIEVQIFADKHGTYLYNLGANSSCCGPFWDERHNQRAKASATSLGLSYC